METQDEVAPRPGVAPAHPDFEALYLEHKDAMWSKALRMLDGDHNRAGDAVQTAIVKIMSNPPSNVRSWKAVLVTAVKRTILDWWKSAEHRREQLLIDGDAPLDGCWLGDHTLGMDPAEVLEEEHERLEMHAVAREALAQLRAASPDAHYAYVQVKLGDRKSKDVATEMGVSDSRVRQHLMAARSEIEKVMEARGGER